MAAPVIPDAASEILRDQKHIGVVKMWVVLRDQSLFKSEEGGACGGENGGPQLFFSRTWGP